MRKNCSILAGTREENHHGHIPLPRNPTHSSISNKQSRNRCLHALVAHAEGKLRHVGQGRPLVARQEVMGCLERCWLIPVPLSHVWTPRVQEQKKRATCSMSPLGPGGLCRVMGLCLSTLKLLLNVPRIKEIPGKSLSEAALNILLAPNCAAIWGLSIPVRLPPVPAPIPAPAPTPCRDRTPGLCIHPCCRTVPEGSGNATTPTVTPNPQPALPPPAP